jgi:hypothetical protein
MIDGGEEMTDEQKEPKIIVDEDWKSQVQAEKEAAAAAAQQQQSEVTAEGAADPEQPQAKGDDAAKAASSAGMGHIPPASLDVLLSTLAAQAMTAMGHLPDPVEGHPVVRPDLAKHYIDMVGMLEEKTKGNLTPDEANMIESVLHELRMIFVTTRGQTKEKT